MAIMPICDWECSKLFTRHRRVKNWSSTSWASWAFSCSIRNLLSLFSLCSRAAAFSNSLCRMSRMYLQLDFNTNLRPLPVKSKSWPLPSTGTSKGNAWPLQLNHSNFKIYNIKKLLYKITILTITSIHILCFMSIFWISLWRRSKGICGQFLLVALKLGDFRLDFLSEHKERRRQWCLSDKSMQSKYVDWDCKILVMLTSIQKSIHLIIIPKCIWIIGQI